MNRKHTIRLNETELNKIISETIKAVLEENYIGHDVSSQITNTLNSMSNEQTYTFVIIERFEGDDYKRTYRDITKDEIEKYVKEKKNLIVAMYKPNFNRVLVIFDTEDERKKLDDYNQQFKN